MSLDKIFENFKEEVKKEITQTDAHEVRVLKCELYRVYGLLMDSRIPDEQYEDNRMCTAKERDEYIVAILNKEWERRDKELATSRYDFALNDFEFDVEYEKDKDIK